MKAQRSAVTQRHGYIWGGDVGERSRAGRLALTGGLRNLTCNCPQADHKITSADNFKQFMQKKKKKKARCCLLYMLLTRVPLWIMSMII